MHKYAALTPDVIHILKNKYTEQPFSGKYHNTFSKGSYLCCGCGAVLFHGDSQFHSGCGWPSFDDEVSGSIKRIPDIDGRRTEIVCACCEGHLGHVFTGEKFTDKNVRHCVNSLAIEFVKNTTVKKTEEAIVAGGCFWGVQYLLDQLPGVLLTEVGYTGGDVANPTYHEVCRNHTGHVEAVRVVYDAEKISYETIMKYFMEIHDPTQQDGQGPDRGSQYLSRIFYFDEKQKKIAHDIIQQLVQKGFDIATNIKPVKTFWPAEEAHQHYYEKNKLAPYCHHRVKRF